MRARSAFTVLEVMIAIGILATALMTLLSLSKPLRNSAKDLAERQRAAEVAALIMERFQGASWQDLGRQPWSWHRIKMDELPTGSELFLLQYADELGASIDTEFLHRPMTDEPGGISIYDFLRDPNGDGIYTDAVDLADLERDGYDLPVIRYDQRDEFNDPRLGTSNVLSESLRLRYDTPQRYNWLQFLGVLNDMSELKNLRIYVEYYQMGLFHDATTVTEWHDAMDDFRMPSSHLILNMNNLADMDQDAVIIRLILAWDSVHGGETSHEVTIARRK